MFRKSAYQITALVTLCVVLSPLTAQCEDIAGDDWINDVDFNIVDPINLAQLERAQPPINLPPVIRQPPTLSLGQPTELRFPRSLFDPQRRYARIERRLARTPPRISFRLSSMPNMFGDFLDADFAFRDEEFSLGISTDVPLGGVGRGVKVSENNRAMPTNRAFVMYQHYHNALQVDVNSGVPVQLMQFNVDQYTVGLERTFSDGYWSFGVRAPLLSSFGFRSASFGIEGGQIGNLSVALKRLLWYSEDAAISGGIGVATPTGSDAVGFVATDAFRVRNEAVHLIPFIGFQHAPTDVFFYQGFIQLDLATNGNRVELTDTTSKSGPTTIGTYTEQNLLHVDMSAGWWLLGAVDNTSITGVAMLVELHYTSTVQDTDRVAGTLSSGSPAIFTNTLNRVDPLHFTFGLHTEVNTYTAIRVGAVFPLNDVAERLFDSEFLLQINRRF